MDANNTNPMLKLLMLMESANVTKKSAMNMLKTILAITMVNVLVKINYVMEIKSVIHKFQEDNVLNAELEKLEPVTNPFKVVVIMNVFATTKNAYKMDIIEFNCPGLCLKDNTCAPPC